MATKKAKVTKKVTKKAPSKAAAKTVHKVIHKKAVAKAQAFKVASESAPFVSFKVTDQTVYWSVLLAYVLLLSLWILKIQMDTLAIIEKINLL